LHLEVQMDDAGGCGVVLVVDNAKRVGVALDAGGHDPALVKKVMVEQTWGLTETMMAVWWLFCLESVYMILIFLYLCPALHRCHILALHRCKVYCLDLHVVDLVHKRTT
jgi:hypothetical protein